MQSFISISPLLSSPSLRSPLTPNRRHCSPPSTPRRPPRALLPDAISTTTALSPATLLLSTSAPLLSFAEFLAGPCINAFNLVMIIRIILSWYPKTDLAKAPWIYIAVPTEPLLKATRKVVPPVGGVDISPIVWFAIMSFVHEILVGPQGLLVLLGQK